MTGIYLDMFTLDLGMGCKRTRHEEQCGGGNGATAYIQETSWPESGGGRIVYEIDHSLVEF
jgi:hypothetical protein